MYRKSRWLFIGLTVCVATTCDPVADAVYPTPTPTPVETPQLVATPRPTPEFDYQLRWPDARLAITHCVNTGASGGDDVVKEGTVARVSGSLLNTTNDTLDYIISVAANHGDTGLGTGSAQLFKVPSGKTKPWTTTVVVTNAYPGQALACSVLAVNASE